VALGVPLLGAAAVLGGGGVDGAVQRHARLALASGAMVLYWAVVSGLDGQERVGAVTLALAGAVTTAYVLLSGLAYFGYDGPYALPLARLVADLLAL